MENNKKIDYYKLLDIDSTATRDQIHKAFMAKALEFHPDKADPADRERYTDIYTDLKEAYRILSNDVFRKQYTDAQQATFVELRNKVEVGYEKTTQFTKITSTGINFDKEGFMEAFDKKRDSKLIEAPTGTITNAEYMDYIAKRESETQTIAPQLLFEYEKNTFNQAFELIKNKAPSKGLTQYVGEPSGLFSSRGVSEVIDNASQITMTNGFEFASMPIDDIVQGFKVNPAALEGFEVTDVAPEPKLGKVVTDDLLRNLRAEREGQLNNIQYSQEPSEIEKIYSSLFAPLQVERLNKRKETSA